MGRNSNTDVNGKPFAATTIGAVWNKGTVINGHDPKIWRRDICGHAMKLTDYGNTGSDYGWEVDHKIPVARGGNDLLTNLQPLYWGNNRKKSDTYPWNCS